jgi:gamma-glutamylcyclotransferase (GGCT)/AIG2-like uncharacterized protein YtfP
MSTLDPAAISCLFVYGTLRRASQHAMAKYLAARSAWLGLARMPGRLYDLGQYPGLLEAVDAADWVCGDLYELADPDHTLAVLDRYEGYSPSDAHPWLFERVPATATLADGVSRPAWVYMYRQRVREEQRIHAGDYYP